MLVNSRTRSNTSRFLVCVSRGVVVTAHFALPLPTSPAGRYLVDIGAVYPTRYGRNLTSFAHGPGFFEVSAHFVVEDEEVNKRFSTMIELDSDNSENAYTIFRAIFYLQTKIFSTCLRQPGVASRRYRETTQRANTTISRWYCEAGLSPT